MTDKGARAMNEEERLISWDTWFVRFVLPDEGKPWYPHILTLIEKDISRNGKFSQAMAEEFGDGWLEDVRKFIEPYPAEIESVWNSVVGELES